MSEKHDVTKSSNPDVQALIVVIGGLNAKIERLAAEVSAVQAELASLPQSYVVPGPAGEIPAGTVVSGTGEAKATGDVVSIKPAKVKAGKAVA